MLKDEFDWFLSEDFTSVRNLPPYSYSSEPLPIYYSEGEYPVRIYQDDMIMIDEGLGGSFSYTQKVTPPSPLRPQTTCPKCGEKLDPDPFIAKIHNCEGTD